MVSNNEYVEKSVENVDNCLYNHPKIGGMGLFQIFVNILRFFHKELLLFPKKSDSPQDTSPAPL